MLVRVRHKSGGIYLVNLDPAKPVFRALSPDENSLFDRLGVRIVWDGLPDFERDQVRRSATSPPTRSRPERTHAMTHLDDTTPDAPAVPARVRTVAYDVLLAPVRARAARPGPRPDLADRSAGHPGRRHHRRHHRRRRPHRRWARGRVPPDAVAPALHHLHVPAPRPPPGRRGRLAVFKATQRAGVVDPGRRHGVVAAAPSFVSARLCRHVPGRADASPTAGGSQDLSIGGRVPQDPPRRLRSS